MQDIKSRWLTFYAEHVEQTSKEIFGHVEKMIVGTLIVSAGAHVSSNEPAIVLFGYLRHGLVGRGVELFGVVVLLHRVVGPISPVDPCLSRRVADGLSKTRRPRTAHNLLRRELGQNFLA